jgi:hypothetical protein
VAGCCAHDNEILGSLKCGWNYWLAEQLLASKVDLCSMMIVNVIIVMKVKKKGKYIPVTGRGVQ